MADDRMKNDDLERNLGAGGEENYGKKSPGRDKQDDERFGQQGGRQGTSGRDMRDMEHDDRDSQHGSRSGQTGGTQNQGGQNR